MWIGKQRRPRLLFKKEKNGAVVELGHRYEWGIFVFRSFFPDLFVFRLRSMCGILKLGEPLLTFCPSLMSVLPW